MCVTGYEVLLHVALAVRSAVIRHLLDERTHPSGRRFASTEDRGVEGSEENFHCPKVLWNIVRSATKDRRDSLSFLG